MAELLLTVEQAALRLQVHPLTLRRYLREGQVRGIKRGRLWRVPESALQEPAPVALKLAAPEGQQPRNADESRGAGFLAAMKEFDEAFEREGCTGLDVEELFREMREDRGALR